MNNIKQQQLFDFYMKQCFNLYPSRNIYPDNYVNMLQNGNQNNNGFLRINILNQVDKTPVSNATVTLYVTDGMQRDIPVLHLITTINPIRIELPMANELGTLIAGPVYDFSTYNLRVDAFGYFANIIYNIRLFPDITYDLEVIMIPVSLLEAQPLIEERVNIPPHPRDEINGGNN